MEGVKEPTCMTQGVFLALKMTPVMILRVDGFFLGG